MIRVNATRFAQGARQSQDRWNLLVGRKVVHKAFGEGVVSKAIVQPDGSVTITIVFQGNNKPVERRFSPVVCQDLEDIEFPEELFAQRRPAAAHQKTATLSASGVHPVNEPEIVKVRPVPKFEINADVCVANDPSQRGMVVKVIPDHGGTWNYEVYVSAERRPIFKESDLRHYVPVTQWGRLEDFLRALAMVKMRKPMSDALYALYASRTKFEVYQFKPALKFLANPDQRLLIADEVGLGKTIEAGIIYLELQARVGLERVLIVCPSSLKEKWRTEMKSRFDEDFVILDRTGITNFLQTQQMMGDDAPLRAIVSLESIRRREVAEKFADIKLDMVVIDEAHHCRNTGTLANAIASTLTENSSAALLLTATPLQMGQTDLFNLLRILSPGEFDNFNAFAERLEPNRHVNLAAEYLSRGMYTDALEELKKVEHTSERKRFLGNPYYNAITKSLTSESPTRQDLVAVQRRLLELNTLASIFTRTRKRDVQEKAPQRTAYTLTVNFSPEEEGFYNDVVEEVRINYQMQHLSGKGSGWVTIMKERQAASCISALLRKMDRNAQGWNHEEESFLTEFAASELSGSADDWVDDFESLDTINVTKRHPKQRVAKPASMRDSKFEVFWDALIKVLEDNPKSKVLVFSFFVGTIEHIRHELDCRGVNVRAIHGGYAVVERQKIIEEFRDNPSVRVLVSSDVGSEGLDFQFCDTLFNYDLPWNPMKVEQRIGRIDRFGQESERIRIYNLVIANSIESRILMRLYDRIEIFKHAIGDIEVILGEQIRELTQAVFSSRLSAAEERKRADKAVEIILRQRQEMEDFESQRMQFLGQEAILSTAVNQAIDSGRFISDVEVHALVSGYVKENFQHSRLESNGAEDDTYTLVVNEDLAQEVKTFIYGSKKNDRTAYQFLPRLVAGKDVPLTFSHDLAYKRKLLEFITPRHPLAQAALNYWKEKSRESNLVYRINFQTDVASAGKYYFFIYLLETQGIDSDTRIIPIVISADSGDKNNVLSDQFLRLTQTSGMPHITISAQFDEGELSAVEKVAFQHMTMIRDHLTAELTTSNDALVNARLAAVEQSYLAKDRHLKETLAKVKDARIRRMYEAQIRNLNARKKAKEIEIERGRQLSVNFALQLRGFLEVEHDAKS